jgi:CheY-specific phosphatase CheX
MHADPIHQNLEHSITNMLSEFFLKQVPSEKLNIVAIPKKDLAFSEHMVIMLLSNAQIRMFLKIHFHIDEAKRLAAVRQHKTWNDLSDKVAIDFMKELCNVLGGRLKRKIAHLQLELGQSIPLDLEGFCEIFFEDVNWSSQTLVFRVSNPQLQVMVSAQYEITGQEARDKLTTLTDDSKEAEEDDIEFL